MQVPQKYIARYEEKIELNEKFTQYSFELREPHRLDFMAGQYLSVKVSEAGLRRSYSICSSPDIKHGFEFLVDHSPAGVGCKFFEGLEFGEEIEVLGPMGIFVMADDPAEKEVFLIATGSGIAPFRSMILNQLQVHHDERNITLLWGMRHETELFWELEFQELSENFPNFTFIPTISQPSERWPLQKGRVTDYLKQIELPNQAGYYLCGNAGMIDDAKALLAESDIDSKHIHHEKFY